MAKAKKTLDKDMMFQKMMPALAGNPFSTLSTESTQESTNTEPSSPAPKEEPTPKSSIENELLPHNINEILVQDHIDQVIKKFNCCSCPRCRQDITIIALNALAPQYVALSQEETEKMVQQSDVKPVYNALIKGVLQVRSHPNH